MNETTLAELMRRGTNTLPHPDLVPAALVGARRVRRRRRAAIATAAVAVLAIAVVAPVIDLHHGRTVQPAGSPQVRDFTAPALPASIIQKALDPNAFDRLPHGTLGLPIDLTPSGASDAPPGRALMVTKERRGDQQTFYALDTSHRWHRLQVDAPADIGNGLGPMLDLNALSPDGTEVALRGATHVYVVDLDTGRTASRPSTGGTQVAWSGDHRLRLLDSTGTTSDGDTEIRAGGSNDGFTETRDGKVLLHAHLGSADRYLAQDPVATTGRIALAAAPGFQGLQRRPGIGLLVLDRPTYRGLAFLPVSIPDDLGLAGGPLLPRAWVGSDELLFSMAPRVDHGGTTTMTRQDYLTWNIRTGEVRREASTDQYWRDSSWAADLLR